MDSIILDYGHGGIDANGKYTTAPSKMAKVNGQWVYEGVINRILGGMLYHLLKWDGYNVIETVKCNDARDLSLPYRVKVANSVPNAIFISIHCNASPNQNGRGFEIFTTRGQNNSDKLAQSIADSVEHLKDTHGLKMRFDLSDGDKDKEADHYVTRKCKHPSVLLECFFFDNAQDLALFNDMAFRQEFVSSVYKGIKAFIT